MTRRGLALAGAVVIAALLAFPLRETIHEAIVVPAAYLLWALGLLYRSLSQGIWWVILAVMVMESRVRSSSRLPGRTGIPLRICRIIFNQDCNARSRISRILASSLLHLQKPLLILMWMKRLIFLNYRLIICTQGDGE